MYKTILVHANAGDPGAEARVRCAASLARDYHARLIGAAARMPLPAVALQAAGAPLLAAGLVTADPGELAAEFAEAEGQFRAWTSGTCAETEWRTAIDFPSSALAAMATAVDLIVVGRSAAPADGFRSPDCGDLIMKAGRPVLVVPENTAALNLNGAVVAWKDTREARRAVSDALPLLAQTEMVTILHVSERGGEEPPPADAKGFLDRHGIGSRIATASTGGGPVAGAIVDMARRTQSGLIVAGAYGHARIREWVFGGVTRDLLATCPLPCLFSR